MADIFVYAPNCEDFDNIGECGPLICEAARFIEEANGASELTIEHPIDEDVGRWSFLQEGYLLQAEVPVRTTPEIADGLIVTQTQTWKIKTTATKGERALYNKASGGKKLATVNIWKDKAKTIRNTVLVVSESDSRYKVKRSKGYGYISKNAVEEGYSNLPLEQTPEAIETIVPAWSIKPQLFRMHAPEITDKKVTVKARHISYDLLGNSTTYDPIRTHPTWSSSTAYVVGSVVYETNTKLIYFCIKANTNVRPPNTTYWTINPTCGAALAGVLRNCAKTHEFEGFTNIADERVISDWIDVSPIEALLSPENGILASWNADLVRDNWELTVLNDAGLNRGVRIEYGKNLTGVKVSLDTSDLITSIRPIGQTSKGKPLYLTAGTYTVDGRTVVVDSSLTVSSSHESEYPTPHVYTLDLGTAAKATGTSSSAVLAAKNKMIKACLDMFTNEKCDLPLLTLTVEFIALDSTEEYAQYKQLENVYLFDRVTVWHPKIAVDILTSVQRVEFDPIKESFVKIEVSPVRRDASRKKIPSWKLPPVQEVAYGAIGPGDLDEYVAESLDLLTNESVQIVAQQYVKNAWITGEQVFKYSVGAPAPTPSSIVVSANLQNVLVYRWQFKDSLGEWEDYPVGDGNDTNTSSALIVKSSHATWVDDVCTLQLLTNDLNIFDTFCLYKVYDGEGIDGVDGIDGLTAILSNSAHTLPKTTAGVVTYTGSGTMLRVFEGATELSYDGIGTSSGTWKITASTSGITCGAISDGGLYAVVGNHSDMTGATAKVTYSIVGKRQNGTAFALTVEQSLSISQQGDTGATGATGASAVVLTVYAPNGSVFTNQTGTLLLSAVGYSGANQITSGATYQWKKYTGGSWVAISGATASTLTVSGTDVLSLQAYKCEMTYGGVVYSGTITLTDKTDNYQAAISSTAGNTFRNGMGNSAMICGLWQNGVEVDALKSTTISETAPSSPTTGQFYYKITPSTPQVALMRWSGSAWVDVTTNPTYAHSKNYTWYRRDKDGNALDGGDAFATGKVIYVDGDDVDIKTTWECEVA